MKLESRTEHAAALDWMQWVMKEHGPRMPEPVGAWFNHVARMVDQYERVHYPIAAPEAGDPCFDCGHVHEGPETASPYEEMPPGKACIKCACKVRT